MLLTKRLYNIIKYNHLVSIAETLIARGGYGYEFRKYDGHWCLLVGDPAYNQVGHLLTDDQYEWLSSRL